MERSWKKFFMVSATSFVSGVAVSGGGTPLGVQFLTTDHRRLQGRGSPHVHARYLSTRAYYRAAVLRVGNPDNADQRIVEDLNQFCATASDLCEDVQAPPWTSCFPPTGWGRAWGTRFDDLLLTFPLGAVTRAGLAAPFSRVHRPDAA